MENLFRLASANSAALEQMEKQLRILKENQAKLDDALRKAVREEEKKKVLKTPSVEAGRKEGTCKVESKSKSRSRSQSSLSHHDGTENDGKDKHAQPHNWLFVAEPSDSDEAKEKKNEAPGAPEGKMPGGASVTTNSCAMTNSCASQEKVSLEGSRGAVEAKLAKLQRKVVELIQERAEMAEQLEEHEEAKCDGLLEEARKAKLVKAVQEEEEEEENQRLEKQVDEEKSRCAKFETDFGQMRFKPAESSQLEREELQEQLDGHADIEDMTKAQPTDMRRHMDQKDDPLGRQESEVLELKGSLKKLMNWYAEMEKRLHAANKMVATAAATEDDDDSAAAAPAAKTVAPGDKDDYLRSRCATFEEKTREHKDPSIAHPFVMTQKVC